MPDDLLIARNPEPDSTLPYLVRIPLGPAGVVVKAREPWPREKKVFCHRETSWPSDVEILERHAVVSCVRRGPAIDLVLQRAREKRSQFVLTHARGREMIFWQSPKTTKQARPAVRIPTARAHGQVLDIVVDSGEKYPYAFRNQQATTRRERLPVGDYAVQLDGVTVATVERKTLEDLAGSLLSGRLTYALAELTALPRAAVVVEDRYSRIFKFAHAPGAAVAEALAEAQARFPAVPIVFCETRPLAEEWTYRWLGACVAELDAAAETSLLETSFVEAGPAPVSGPPSGVVRSTRASRKAAAERTRVAVAELSDGRLPVGAAAEIRVWARAAGFSVSDRGRISADLLAAYQAAARRSG